MPNTAISTAKLADDFIKQGGPKEKALADMAAIENPRLTHVGNMDCVSCHVLNRADYLESSDIGDRLPASWEAPDDKIRLHVPDGISAYTRYRNGLWKLHNFGYLKEFASIAPRTVAETALVVELTNQMIAGKKPRHPGISCETSEKLKAALDCRAPAEFFDQPCHPEICKTIGN